MWAKAPQPSISRMELPWAGNCSPPNLCGRATFIGVPAIAPNIPAQSGENSEPNMIAISLVAALLLGAPQQADSSKPQWTPQQLEGIRQKQEAMRLQREP